MRALDVSWSTEQEPHATVLVDGHPLSTAGINRVVVVIDTALEEPVLDVSYGTPLPVSLSDDGPHTGEMTPLQFLEAVDIERLRSESLEGLGGLDGDDPITVCVKILRRWAGGN